MTYVARWTCPVCGSSSRQLHYDDTRAPVMPCGLCGWSLPHDEAMRRIEQGAAEGEEAAADGRLRAEKRAR